jgi:hypothetical protein
LLLAPSSALAIAYTFGNIFRWGSNKNRCGLLHRFIKIK